MSNYILHANFTTDISNQIIEARSVTWELCPELISNVSLEHPRMIVLYGPKIEKKEITVFDKATVEDLYPGLLTTNFQLPFFYIFRGISHFKRDNRYIIKMEFASIALTNLQMALRRSLPAVDANYLAAHLTDNDKSRISQPERWLYVTICEVTNISDVPDVEEAARNALQYFPPLVEAVSLSIDSDTTTIPLPFIKQTVIKPLTSGHLAMHISDVLEVANDETSIGVYSMNRSRVITYPVRSIITSADYVPANNSEPDERDDQDE